MCWEAGTQGRSALSQGDMDLVGPCRSSANVWGQGAGQRAPHSIPCLNRVMHVHDGEDPSLECSGPLDALLGHSPLCHISYCLFKPPWERWAELGGFQQLQPSMPPRCSRVNASSTSRREAGERRLHFRDGGRYGLVSGVTTLGNHHSCNFPKRMGAPGRAAGGWGAGDWGPGRSGVSWNSGPRSQQISPLHPLQRAFGSGPGGHPKTLPPL